MSQLSTILIVDDGPLGRATLDGLLRTGPYELVFAESGAAALTIAGRIKPDLVLLDIMMSGIDGFEVCRRIRADPDLAEIPIILLTALDDRDVRMQGLAAGADDCISKPFDRLELRTRVQTITRLNRYRQLVSTREQCTWVMDKATDGYVMIDDYDTIVYANNQAQGYLGMPSDQAAWAAETFFAWSQHYYRYEEHAAWVGWPKFAGVIPRFLVAAHTAHAGPSRIEITVLDESTNPSQRHIICLRDATARVIRE